MPVHAALLADLVTGAAKGLVGAISDRFDGGIPVIATGGPGFPGAGPIPTTTVGDPSAGVGTVEAGVGDLVARLPGVIRGVLAPAVVGIGAAELVTRNGGGARTVTRKQLILMTARAANPGATSKKIIRSARQCGIELAAATFGLNVLDVCFLIAQPATRRARGISAADFRCVSRTARKFDTLQHNLSHLRGPTRRYTSHKRK